MKPKNMFCGGLPATRLLGAALGLTTIGTLPVVQAAR
jgi:hypothetical protein